MWSFHIRRRRSRSRRLHIAVGAQFLALAAIAALAVGCGGGSGYSMSASSTSAGSGSAAAETDRVTIADFTFEPADITVSKGTTVVFTNNDSTAHTATSKQSGAFESGSIQPGKSGKVTLDKTGTFDYFCAFHPFMKGTITVE